MPWKFRPQQRHVKVVPGETALAFYRAINPTEKAITGVATYNVFPPKAGKSKWLIHELFFGLLKLSRKTYHVGLYFNKIQCFCFEEQRLRPGDDIDMPVICLNSLFMCLSILLESSLYLSPAGPRAEKVFFFIDKDILNDPSMDHVNDITLSYTFFKTGEDDACSEDEETTNIISDELKK